MFLHWYWWQPASTSKLRYQWIRGKGYCHPLLPTNISADQELLLVKHIIVINIDIINIIIIIIIFSSANLQLLLMTQVVDIIIIIVLVIILSPMNILANDTNYGRTWREETLGYWCVPSATLIAVISCTNL